MQDALHAWETFYVIIGSSAAALTGLQFVVIALISEAANIGGGEEEVATFGTPTIVHFCAVLLIAAFCSIPHQSAISLGICITITAIIAIVYMAGVIGRARRTRGYVPVLEDWIFHAITPGVSYVALLISGVGMRQVWALYVIAAAALLLLYTGIHNAWDTAMYISTMRRKSE